MSQDVRKRPRGCSMPRRDVADKRELADREFVYGMVEWCQVAGITPRMYRDWRWEKQRLTIGRRMPPAVTTKTAIYGFIDWVNRRKYRLRGSRAEEVTRLRDEKGWGFRKIAAHMGTEYGDMRLLYVGHKRKLAKARALGIVPERMEELPVPGLRKKRAHLKTGQTLPWSFSERAGRSRYSGPYVERDERFVDCEDEDR